MEFTLVIIIMMPKDQLYTIHVITPCVHMQNGLRDWFVCPFIHLSVHAQTKYLWDNNIQWFSSDQNNFIMRLDLDTMIHFSSV